jgi:hypothetical protein
VKSRFRSYNRGLAGDFHLSPKADIHTRTTYLYTLCGWKTRSEIPLTGVPTSSGAGSTVDILIQIAPGHSPITTKQEGLVLEHSVECSRIRIEAVADFEVYRGQQISVWPAAGATQKDIEIFLFGPVWATLCYQRGLLPLHASAILADGCTYSVCRKFRSRQVDGRGDDELVGL